MPCCQTSSTNLKCSSRRNPAPNQLINMIVTERRRRNKKNATSYTVHASALPPRCHRPDSVSACNKNLSTRPKRASIPNNLSSSASYVSNEDAYHTSFEDASARVATAGNEDCFHRTFEGENVGGLDDTATVTNDPAPWTETFLTCITLYSRARFGSVCTIFLS